MAAAAEVTGGGGGEPNNLSMSTSRDGQASMLQQLFAEGLDMYVLDVLSMMYKRKKFDQAEEKWRKALEIDQNDVQTLLHYSVMVRDHFQDKERADQLMRLALGESQPYVSVGLRQPANKDEVGMKLHRQPRLVPQKKDMKKMLFFRQSLRSKVEFHSLKFMKMQLKDVWDENDESLDMEHR
ncbi:hypothetical protein GUITHDRAFT_145928 [Guillardia theta CCMP2712]|uniref:Uncharacterized protein n=1 Tax=Guillardia theta (strain CCMP2712) TaxID=905079 RepID=L1IJZ6_GUITC|nr:hypothetical protein GUITHDRAFT_145928 [Guillardia theta CCMP2712]EKX36244.1 hypothetical protein GUITHDRAFT_145928 [Guillardia theta CCMP2712]|eukprot:XP_005823224.1 hypothetical protein GUITHDRAFT_145928 [Guillardia theta CCMP2712]